MQIISKTTAAFSIGLGIMLGVAFAVIGEVATPIGWPLGVVVAVITLVLALRRPARRWRTSRRDLSETMRQWLVARVPLYRALDRGARERLERDIKFVLDEWTFEGVDGVEIMDDVRLGVAAGAAVLLHGRPEWELPAHQAVLIYPDHFDLDYLGGEDAVYDGMAHSQGPVILAADAVKQSWQTIGDGSNVVLHELAHLLDYENEFADGVPSLIDPSSTVAWQQLMHRETRRIRIGRSLLRRYAARNAAEFFAVAVENFFDRPSELKKRHPELYKALSALFNLDPAAIYLPEGEGGGALHSGAGESEESV